MLDRNRRIKKCPEKFQHCTEQFDLIITAEERVYDQVSFGLYPNYRFEINNSCLTIIIKVVEYMESKPPTDNKPVHVINIDIQDNHEEATMGAFSICDLVAMVILSTNVYFSFSLLFSGHSFNTKCNGFCFS